VGGGGGGVCSRALSSLLNYGRNTRIMVAPDCCRRSIAAPGYNAFYHLAGGLRFLLNGN
jgi:hypothetical protein